MQNTDAVHAAVLVCGGRSIAGAQGFEVSVGKLGGAPPQKKDTPNQKTDQQQKL